MIVCQCRAVNDERVRRAIDLGADDLVEIARSCGAGLGCGGCHPLLVELLLEARTGARSAA